MVVAKDCREKPLKWLLINYEFPPLGGGAGVATQSFARELAGLGHEVTVLTTRLRNQPGRELTDGYLVLRVRCLRRKKRGIESSGDDIVSAVRGDKGRRTGKRICGRGLPLPFLAYLRDRWPGWPKRYGGRRTL